MAVIHNFHFKLDFGYCDIGISLDVLNLIVQSIYVILECNPCKEVNVNMPYPKEYACHFLGVGGVVIHENKVLLVKPNYGFSRGKWVIPGGLVECGETLQEAVVREIKEETNLEVEPIGIVSIRAMVRKSDNLTDVYCIFLCKASSSAPLSVQQSELSDARWFSLNGIETNNEIADFTKVIVKKALSSKPMMLDAESSRVSKSKYLKRFEQFWATSE